MSGAASVRRTIPSQMLIDPPRGVTSQRRACRSMCGTDACTCRRTRTGPITLRSVVWASLVTVSTSGRASRRRLSVGPADNPTAVPRWTGLGPPGHTETGSGTRRRPGGRAEPAGWLQIPCGVAGRRWPVGQVDPASGTPDESARGSDRLG